MNMFSIPTGGHKLPPLPYPYDALEPIIGAETMKIHHDILHRNYVNGLNKAELELEKAREEGNYDQINFLEREIAFNGSGHILHSIFWTIMTPPSTGGQPGPITFYEIIKAFGSFSNFKEQFSAAAAKVQGSGWAILAWNPAWRRLEILTAEKHENLTQWGSIPILVLDVWEHAYYLDYQNKRKEYIDLWWELVNWFEVERRLILAMQGITPLTIK